MKDEQESLLRRWMKDAFDNYNADTGAVNQQNQLNLLRSIAKSNLVLMHLRWDDFASKPMEKKDV